MSKTKFAKWPIFYGGFYKNSIIDFSPQNGLINLNFKDTLRLSVESRDTIDRIDFELSGSPYSFRPFASRIEKKEAYLLKHKFEKKGFYTLTIFVNDKAVLAYKINVKK